MFSDEVTDRTKCDYEMKILIVDDEPLLTEFLSMALGALGFENIIAASSAKAALALMEEASEPFECFLVDIQMPEMDGVELCQEIRKSRIYSKTPILMLTAMSDRTYIESAFSAGANDYITKPFQIDDLMTRIDSAARLSRQIISSDRLVQQIASACKRQAIPFRLKFQDAVSFYDSPDFLEQPTFRNFIDRMERSEFRYGGVVSVKLTNAFDLFRSSKPQYFLSAISEMSDIISTALQGQNCYFTYAGSGCFLVIRVTAGMSRFPNEVEFLINKELSRSGLRQSENDPNLTDISVGRVFRATSGEFRCVDETLERARERTQLACA